MNARQCWVYCLWDGESALYVGSTVRPVRRLAAHRQNGIKYTHHTAEECTELDRYEREAAAIKRFRPKLNCQAVLQA